MQSPLHRSPLTPLTFGEALASARDTQVLKIEHGALALAPQLFRQHLGTLPAIVVTDSQTFDIAGKQVHQAFVQSGQHTLGPFVFTNPNLRADSATVEQLAASLRTHKGIPIAVGAGVINDLVKLASHRVGRPYICVATAASMDGYTAFGASVLCGHAKQTLDCPAPLIVVADLDVVCQAPSSLNAAGYGDLMAKATAGADWLIADALRVEPIDVTSWQIVQSGLRQALAHPEGISKGDSSSISLLLKGLMLSGFAIQHYQSSRPASGAEHQFSHLWDVSSEVPLQSDYNSGYKPPSHGFKVGVACVAVTALYEYLLSQPLETLAIERCCANRPSLEAEEAKLYHLTGEKFEPELIEFMRGELQAKYLDDEILRERLYTLKQVWPQLSARLKEQLLPYPRLKQMLKAAGVPTEPEQIGISRQYLRDSFYLAYCMRRRFTVLDLVLHTGKLDEALDAIFGESEQIHQSSS